MNLVPNSVELKSPSLRNIDQIPLDKRKNICTSIDYSITRHDGYWEKLVNGLGFTENDSKNFQLAFAKSQSPTENLLRECTYRNFRIRTLCQVLKNIGLVKLAEENLEDLDENYMQPYQPYIPIMPHHGLPPNVASSDKPRRHPTESSSSSSVSGSESDKIGGLDTFHFSYEEIQKNTNNFSSEMKLGAGAFGKVYKVSLKNTTFACKVLTIVKDNPLNFSIVSKYKEHSDLRNELRYLAEYRHPNIIPLYGWSLDGKDPCLIYQYMENGSLQDCLGLKGSSSMNWLTRSKIACDAARGLQFLHTAKEKPLIHGDIKTANILLDESFVAKLGDFGLAREGPRKQVTGSYIKLGNEHTPGTIGYLAKEYMDSKMLSVQVDTYAFGVVLLELYTGRRAYERSERKAILLRDYMDDVANTEPEGGVDADTLLFEHQDEQIERLPRKIALQFVKLALECCHFKRTKRPSMLRTLNQLEKIRDDVKLTMHSSGDQPRQPMWYEGKLEVKSPKNNLDRQNWLSTHSKDTRAHVLSRIPIEDDDHSLSPSVANDRDPSLPHENSNIYLPPQEYISKELGQLNMNQTQQPHFHLPSPHPSLPVQMPHYNIQGGCTPVSLPSTNPFVNGSNPAHPSLQNPMISPVMNPVFAQQQNMYMSPMFSMWHPSMSPSPLNLPPNMMSQSQMCYMPLVGDRNQQKLSSPNDEFNMLAPGMGQSANPVSPAVINTPEAFSSLELDSPNLADKNGNLQGYVFGESSANGIDMSDTRMSGLDRSLDTRRTPPKHHSVTLNKVKEDMLHRIEDGCESYTQMFPPSDSWGRNSKN